MIYLVLYNLFQFIGYCIIVGKLFFYFSTKGTGKYVLFILAPKTTFLPKVTKMRKYGNESENLIYFKVFLFVFENSNMWHS